MELRGQVELEGLRANLPPGNPVLVEQYDAALYHGGNTPIRNTPEVLAAGERVMTHVLDMVGQSDLARQPLIDKHGNQMTGATGRPLFVKDYMQVAWKHEYTPPGAPVRTVEDLFLEFAEMESGPVLERRRPGMAALISARKQGRR